MPRTVLVTRHCTTVACPKFRVFCQLDLSLTLLQAIAEGHGDAALLLLKAGAETNKRDADEQLAINLAPDTKVLTFLQAQTSVLIMASRLGSSSSMKLSVKGSTLSKSEYEPKGRLVACRYLQNGMSVAT